MKENKAKSKRKPLHLFNLPNPLFNRISQSLFELNLQESSSNAEASAPAIVDNDTIINPNITANFAASLGSCSCRTCGGVTFESVREQRDHFKTQWHRENINRQNNHLETLTEENWIAFMSLQKNEDKVNHGYSSQDYDSNDEEHDGDYDSKDDGESKTGSSDSSHDSDNHPTEKARAKNSKNLTSSSSRNADAQISLTLKSNDHEDTNTIVTLYKCALPSPPTSLGRDIGIWCVLLIGGGHFALVSFSSSGAVLDHKSFHKYTTRRKQGGTQSLQDSKRGSGAGGHAGPKGGVSAGSTLRRNQEKQLMTDVRNLIESPIWMNMWKNAAKIFLHAPGKNSRYYLYGYPQSPFRLPEIESKILRVPITTYRPKYDEAVRIYQQLTTVLIRQSMQ